MKQAEIKKMSDEEIAVEADRLQRKIFDLRCAVVTEKIEDPSQFHKIRRDVARLKTEQTVRNAKREGAAR